MHELAACGWRRGGGAVRVGGQRKQLFVKTSEAEEEDRWGYGGESKLKDEMGKPDAYRDP
ncbi:hypothetical protein U9M48_028621 [Paspalum notatum var. saurae]|uniref:Uncharacterized protein n=1 Tax=Paspalum notatum var. saurae TaxID=547442 RepID=A0AAQ3TX58_PASNO